MSECLRFSTSWKWKMNEHGLCVQKRVAFSGYIFHWTTWFREIGSEFVRLYMPPSKVTVGNVVMTLHLRKMGAFVLFASLFFFFPGSQFQPRRNWFATRPTSKPISLAIFGVAMRSSRPVPWFKYHRVLQVLAARPRQGVQHVLAQKSWKW